MHVSVFFFLFLKLITFMFTIICFSANSFTVSIGMISEHPQHQLIELKVNNYNLTLNCKAKGFYLIYMWTKNGIPFASDSHYMITEQGLTIINTRPSDRGHYQCIVKNSAGSVKSRIAIVEIFGML